VVTVGALGADVPHTRPVQVVSSAGDRDLAERLGLNISRYEGPTGILGVLGDAATREGIPTIGLWAALPHYLNLAPNPWGAMALVHELGRLLPMTVDTSALAGQTAAFDAAVEELVDDNPELAGYIERLEADSDEDDDEADDGEGSPGLADLPPEELVAEVERYLRDHPGGTRG
jgi:predicted ATP-grasp superfamily ATP-dependent carboligase